MTIELKTKEGEEELPLEILVEHIQKLSDAGKQFQNSRLKNRVIVLLLKDITGLGVREIEMVLFALPKLESQFLKPKPDIRDILAQAVNK